MISDGKELKTQRKIHVDGHTSRRKDSAGDTGGPHCKDPPLEGSEDVGARTTSDDARVTVTVVDEVRELETRYHDQSRCIDERE